ncbi:MAG: hypothetical protein ABIM40_00785 [Pseudomonadota bacterium]
MQNHEVWRHQYRANRYMKSLSIEDLKQRFIDIFNNLMVLDKECKISVPPICQKTLYWITIWTHILEEFEIRFGPYPSGLTDGFIKNVKMPFPSSPMAKKAANTVKTTDIIDDNLLFKYGKSEYIKMLISTGEMRISPASMYNDSSLNHATKDDELSISTCISKDGAKLTVFDGKTKKLKGDIEPIGDITYTAKSKTDYYLSCFSLSYSPRLFLDFEADSCLIIKNRDEFVEKVLSSFEKQLSGWSGWSDIVTYIDPLNFSSPEIDIFTSKHFRYAYQNEFRLLWLPDQPKSDLMPIFIKLPDLKNFCNLIDIS